AGGGHGASVSECLRGSNQGSPAVESGNAGTVGVLDFVLQRVADDPKTTLGTDRHGNTWSAQQNKDGSQTWTQTRNGEIRNAGVNETPRTYNPETGLSRP